MRVESPQSPAEESTVPELIVLCCHSVYLSSTPVQDPSLESSWHLSSFQRSNGRKSGEQETFLLHVLSSLFLLNQRHDSWLVISGGYTARKIINQSEARSYYNACEVLHQSRHPCFGEVWEGARERILLEESATDSFQNLLFSIVLFKKTVGQYPGRITVISHAFKSRRFLDLHAPAIRWPTQRIAIQGINPPFSADDLDMAEEGERSKAYEDFVNDPYGTGRALLQKRQSRGWTEGSLGSLAENLEPGVQNLLFWKGGESGKEIYQHDLPWAEQNNNGPN